MGATPIRLHILQEYGVDFRPHPTSYIRLLRPLTHPSLSDHLEVTWDLRFEMRDVDVVILDRLWHRDVSMRQIENLINDVSRRNAKLIYAIDDDLLNLPSDRTGWPTSEHREIVRGLLQASAGVLVTTDTLRDRFSSFNSNIIVVPNALDERLIVRSMMGDQYNPFSSRRITIGYMGTRTHLGDLEMISKAIRSIADRFSEKAEFQVLGVAESEDLERVLEGIPYRLLSPPAGEEEYPQFRLW